MITKKLLLLAAAMCILALGSVAMGQPYLDCSDATVITCGDVLTNQTPPGEPGAGNVTYYCDTYTLNYDNAWEFVYEFTLEASTFVTIVMTYDHVIGVNDLDMGLRNICDENNCLNISLGTTGYEEMNNMLWPGTYIISIDGYNGYQDGSPHTMSLICGPVAAEATTWSEVKGLYR